MLQFHNIMRALYAHLHSRRQKLERIVDYHVIAIKRIVKLFHYIL